jgi:hypothetical protein
MKMKAEGILISVACSTIFYAAFTEWLELPPTDKMFMRIYIIVHFSAVALIAPFHSNNAKME